MNSTHYTSRSSHEIDAAGAQEVAVTDANDLIVLFLGVFLPVAVVAVSLFLIFDK